MSDSQQIKPTGVKLNPELKNRLANLSKLKDRSTHWLMKEAISRYVQQEEQTELLKQETLKRWSEVEAGKVYSNDSVMDWLKTWGTEDEIGRPE